MFSTQDPGAPGVRRPAWHRRRRKHRPAAWCAALATVAGGVSCVLAFAPGDEQPITTAHAVAESLPWPHDGQTSVEVEGLGSLGTAGEKKPVPIASVTKVMTAYVILRRHPLSGAEPGPLIRVDREAAYEALSRDETSAPVREGQTFTERQLLELMLIPSGNNVARLLARWDAGTQEAFVAEMNRAAAGLGMTRTTYTGASGVEPTTTSTAADQLKLARQAMDDEALRSIVAEPRARVPGLPGAVVNTNTLLGEAGVIGLKTGSSTAAGGALMWAAEARVGDTQRLVLGVVLHQHAGTTPEAGLRAALAGSRRLITAIQNSLASFRPSP